eukprot:m51a1_g8764 putative tyrosine-protein kinase src42a (745) ;mRNA; f:141837-144393
MLLRLRRAVSKEVWSGSPLTLERDSAAVSGAPTLMPPQSMPMPTASAIPTLPSSPASTSNSPQVPFLTVHYFIRSMYYCVRPQGPRAQASPPRVMSPVLTLQAPSPPPPTGPRPTRGASFDVSELARTAPPTVLSMSATLPTTAAAQMLLLSDSQKRFPSYNAGAGVSSTPRQASTTGISGVPSLPSTLSASGRRLSLPEREPSMAMRLGGNADSLNTARSMRSLAGGVTPGRAPSCSLVSNSASLPLRGSLVLLRDVVPGDIIGRGRSVVYRGVWEGTTPVAMKTVMRISSKSSTTAQRENIVKEAAFLARMRHPRIVQMFGIAVYDGTLFLVTELAQGSLISLLRGKQLEKTAVLRAALDVVAGMNYLAQNGVVHRDLACRNILYSRSGPDNTLVAKVSDFGVSRIRDTVSLPEDGHTSTEMELQSSLPMRWMAPESMEENQWSEKSDVWSMGVALWEMMTNGTRPWEGLTNTKVCEMVLKGSHLPKPPECSDTIYAIMEECWQMHPEQRPTFRQLFQELRALTGQAPGASAGISVVGPAPTQAPELDDAKVETYSSSVPSGSAPAAQPIKIEDSGVITWTLDKKDIIVAVTHNPRDQQPLAGSREPEKQVGRHVYKLINGAVTQNLYRMILTRVRNKQKPFTLMYYVEWNGSQRHCELRFAPQPEGQVSLASKVISALPISRPEPISREMVPKKMEVCSFCNRVSPGGDAWQSDKDIPRNDATITCCPDCFEDLSERVSEA